MMCYYLNVQFQGQRINYHHAVYIICIYIFIYTKLITDAARITGTRKEYKILVGASQRKKFLDIYLEARIILKLMI